MQRSTESWGYTGIVSMKYFFEDREGSALSVFLRIPYGQREDIVFTAGSGNLETYVGKHLENQENTAVVYLDTVPNNLSTADIYRELATLSRATNYRCVVIPIVCVEYYFLRSLVGSTVIKDKSLVNLCVSKNYYLGESSLKKHSLKSYDTFERFCKMVCEYSLYRCASIRRSGKLSESHHYTNDACPCHGKDTVCVEPDKSLLEKASKFVSMFPCIPCGGAVKRRVADLEEAWNAHRLLVKEFNSWSALYSVAEPKTTFLTLKPIH